MVSKIIFVYSADSGPLAASLDSARKLANSDDACALCSITHGLLREKAEWRDIECRLGAPTAYYHRDDMPAEVRSFLQERSLPLPIVLFEKDGGDHEVAVPSDALKNCKGDPLCLKRELVAALGREG
ncbi:MAG: hypothetical protein ACRD4U_04790 [Candidatus Acidiferrales bacterium]